MSNEVLLSGQLHQIISLIATSHTSRHNMMHLDVPRDNAITRSINESIVMFLVVHANKLGW